MNIELHSLPPYSPNLNSIERLWKVMNEHARNNRYFATARAFRAFHWQPVLRTKNMVSMAARYLSFTVSAERIIGFVLRDKWCYFFPEFIADPPSAAYYIFTFRIYSLRHSDNPFWDRLLI